MHVRTATAEDQEATLAVHERSVYGLAADHYRDAVVDAWTDLSDDDGTHDDENGQPENGRRFVAEVMDRSVGEERRGDTGRSIVGFGDVRFDPPEYLTEPTDGGVRAVYVDPDATGEGVGSALLERLETTARSEGLDSLGLLASTNARGFYEHHGYEPVHETTFQFGEDVEGPAVEMRKALDG